MGGPTVLRDVWARSWARGLSRRLCRVANNQQGRVSRASKIRLTTWSATWVAGLPWRPTRRGRGPSRSSRFPRKGTRLTPSRLFDPRPLSSSWPSKRPRAADRSACGACRRLSSTLLAGLSPAVLPAGSRATALRTNDLACGRSGAWRLPTAPVPRLDERCDRRAADRRSHATRAAALGSKNRPRFRCVQCLGRRVCMILTRV